MKSDRRKVQAANVLAKDLEGLPDKLKRWGNTALTVLLVAVIIFLLVRWRLNRAEQSRQEINSELAMAHRYIRELGDDLANAPDPARFRDDHAAQAGDAISSVLNQSDDPAAKAEALVARGDLYWQLANFPQLPGATTNPALRPPQSPDDYLTKSADAYQQVLSNPDYLKQINEAVAAHFGLAAIAENRGSWDEAQKQLQLILGNSDVLPLLKAQAQMELNQLPSIQTRLFLSPSTQPAIADAAPATTQSTASAQPATQPAR